MGLSFLKSDANCDWPFDVPTDQELCALAERGGADLQELRQSIPVNSQLLKLKRMFLDSVVSANSKRNYAQALDGLFLFSEGRPLTRALLMEWRATMKTRHRRRSAYAFRHYARWCSKPDGTEYL